MQLVYTLPDALQALVARKLPADTTFALIPLADSFYPEDAQSVAYAKKYADIPLAVALGRAQVFNRDTQHRMAEAGVELFILAPPAAAAVTLAEVTPYVNTTHFMQAIVAVMPSIVVVHPSHLPLVKVSKALESTFPQLFTLLYPPVSAPTGHSAMHDMAQALRIVPNLLQNGERAVAPLLQAAADALKARGFSQIHDMVFYDAHTLAELNDRLQRQAYLFVVAEQGGRRHQYTLSVSV